MAMQAESPSNIIAFPVLGVPRAINRRRGRPPKRHPDAEHLVHVVIDVEAIRRLYESCYLLCTVSPIPEDLRPFALSMWADAQKLRNSAKIA